ncbi:uncharacterized protein LOC131689546 [Topomyia yanbarensis]|uniref:uncharacterized protein LOC131689546 n=1 Tax=Topomyia yanbarensis TaxID=2498891 RepID=UPI00273BFA35|nr:uncharacterized protein LOC131689546 [Topomyia yanbarensis]
MNVMATKMKASTAEFLSGDGIDLNPQKKSTSISSQDQDDLDLLLSEITVQFDDEVQTLYVGPVEIVDDDDEGNGDDCNGPTKNVNRSGATELVVQKSATECVQASASMPQTESEIVTKEVIGIGDDCNGLTSSVDKNVVPESVAQINTTEYIQESASVPQTEVDDVTKADASAEDSNEEHYNKPICEVTSNSTPEPVAQTIMTECILESVPLLPTEDNDVTKEDANFDQPVATEKTNQECVENQQQQQQQLPPPMEVQDAVVGGEPAVVDSANDDRPHLTEAAVVIDPKNGGASQTVPCADVNEPIDKDVRETSPEKSPLDTINNSTRVTRSSSSPVKPTAVISPSTKSKSLSEQQEQQKLSPDRTGKRFKVKSERTAGPTAIKEEIKQLSPVLPLSVDEEACLESEDTSDDEQPLQKEEQTFGKLEHEVIFEAEQHPQEEYEETPEGELIVPDVVPPQQENEERLLNEYNAPYSKETSPAGSDSGIENEGTELNKVVLPVTRKDESNAELTTDNVVENIPESTAEAESSAQVEHDNTQEKVTENEISPINVKSGIRIIKCAKCVMSFKKDLWYKKHLMNYHGIDLSNIAHFLSNLQTLDEGIQDGDGQGVEGEFEQFQLTDGVPCSNDKTDGNNEERMCSSQELEEPAVKKLRRSVPSTPSPATLQMYPEVKLSTSNGKTKTGRRRKDKLIPRNSDADMRIKHEFHSGAVQTEESVSVTSHSSQMDNVYVVTYLEQAAFMAGGGSTSLPGANKENSKSSQLLDPLATDDDFTPFERAKLIETGTEEKRIYACSICGIEFEQRMTAQDHVNYDHKDVKRRSCPHCGRTFTQTGDLTRHVRIHTGIRPFKCPVDDCKYAFISSGDLHKHVRRHNQLLNPIPKPHVCASCGKDFERGYDLKRHSSMHAKDDPNYQGFNCELCGKTFARKDQYRAHTYRHIGYKPHKCTQCSKSFSDASNYAKHLKVHTMDGMSLLCHFCEKPFKNKMAISKHVFHCKYKAVKREIVKQESPL